MHKIITRAGAAAAALALPFAFAGTASAHTAAATCQPDGSIKVTPDYLHLSPAVTVGATTATVVWSDGYRVTVPLPTNCAGPTPTPVPPVPEQIPPPVFTPPGPTPPAPPTCADLARQYPKAGKARRIAWGCATPTTPKVRTSTTTRLVRIVACAGEGTRGHRVYRTRVITTRGDVTLRDVTRRSVVRGPVCHTPAVAG